MTIQECKDKLKQDIIDTLHLEDISPEDITDDMILFSDDGLALDSLDAVELAVMLEKNFGVVVENAEQARALFVSVAVLAEHICSVQAGKN